MDIATAGQIVGIAAVVIPSVFWAVRRGLKVQSDAIFASIEDNASQEKMDELSEGFTKLSDALQEHMDEEQGTNELIAHSTQKLVEQLEKLDSKVAAQALGVAKSVAALDLTPTLIIRVWEGDYVFEWANDAYLDLIGLNLDEARAGQWWLSVHQDERQIVKLASEVTGQAKTDYEGDYTLVHARTQQTIGMAHSKGFPVPGDNGTWFYISQIRVTPIPKD